MEFDGSFEDFQETRQFTCVQKTNLRTKVLKKKKATETAKPESASRKIIKKKNLQQLFALENGTPALKTNKLTFNTHQKLVDIACVFTQTASSVSNATGPKYDDYNSAPCSQPSNQHSDALDVTNKSPSFYHQSGIPVINSPAKANDDKANIEAVNQESHDIQGQSSDHSIKQSDNGNQSNAPISCSDNSESPSQTTDAIWQCPMCKESIASSWRDSHFMHCLKKYEHKKRFTGQKSTTESFICDICKLDITTFSTMARSEHVNRCLDAQIENIKPKDVPCNNVSPDDSAVLILECPLCNKKCSSAQAKLSHVKKCSQALGIDVQSVIVALQLQKKHAVERISLGLPLAPTKSTLPKTKPTAIRKLVREPKCEVDADVQLAKALSLSIEDEEKRKDLLELSENNEMEFLNCSGNQFQPVQLQAPKNDQKPGGRKRKPSKKPVPVLLLRTEEDRLRLLQDKVSDIVITPESMEKPICLEEAKKPSITEVDDSCSISHEKSSVLWNLSGKAGEKMSYYTPELLEFVDPCDIEPGSKLKSLSQVPGHHICTQQPYDFTFNSTLSQNQKTCIATFTSKSPLEIPSTQEMLDIIVEESTSADNNAFPHSQIQPNISSKSSEEEINNDGFLRTKNISQDFLDHNSVLSCLETLINNTWMSDINIAVSDGSLVPAHKLLLMLRCPGLREELTHGEVLYWSDVTNEVCTNFLNFVYTGSSAWPAAMNSKILFLAKRCKMKEFENLKKTFDPNHIFVENEASPLTPGEGRTQEINALNQPVITRNVDSSEKEDYSDKIGMNLEVSDCMFAKMNSLYSPSPFFDISSVSNHFSMSNNDPDINLEENDDDGENPVQETTKQSITVSKYFDDAKDQVEIEIECLGFSHVNETKLSSGIDKISQRSNSPELFICDSDDDIPANQEVNIERSCTSQSTNEGSFLIPRSPDLLTKESVFYKSNDSNLINFPSSPRSNDSSQFLRERCLRPQASKLADTNDTAIQLYSGTDVSDCQQDKEVICIEENDVSYKSPQTGHSADYTNNLNPLLIPDRSVFKIYPIDNSLWSKTTVIHSSNEDSSAASELQSEDDVQSCEEVCQISPSKKHASPIAVTTSNESPYINSPLLDTPVSSRKANRRKQSIFSGSKNCDTPINGDNSCSPNTNRSYEELFNTSCFRSTTKLRSDYSDSVPQSESSILCNESNSLKKDKLQTKVLSFQNSSLEQIIAHEVSCNDAHPVDMEVNVVPHHSDSQTVHKPMFIVNCKSPIILSSDDEPVQNHKSHKSSEIVSSDSDNELVRYNISPVSNSRHAITESPCKHNSFVSMSQPVKRTYEDDDDDDDIEVLPLHMRIQLLQKNEEKKSCPNPALVDVSDDSNGLPCISFSAPISKICHDGIASNSQENVSENRIRTPDLDKQMKFLKNSECFLSDSPITPLPDYQTMVTPEIKMALKKYGIRALPRKKAVSLLSHIYAETHPIVNASGEVINEPETPCLPKVSSSQPCRKRITRKRKTSSQIPQEQTAENSTCINPLSKKTKTSKKTSKSSISDVIQDAMNANKQVSEENMEDFCGSQNSSKSDVSDMPEESFLESDEVFGSQKCENDTLVKRKIHDYIRLNTVLYTKILMYEPLNLMLFQQELKDNGMKISASNLMNFLDEECIIFTLPRSEKSKKKQQQRTQKFRKRMIEKQSQQCSQTCT